MTMKVTIIPLETKLTFDQFVDYTIDTVLKILSQQEVLAHGLMMTPSKLHYIALHFESDKNQWNSMMKAAFDELKPDFYAFVDSAWAVMYKSPEDMAIQPRRHPFRQDMAVIVAFSPKQQASVIIPYVVEGPKQIKAKKPKRSGKVVCNLIENFYK